MKKACIFSFPRMENFHGYSIDSHDPAPYFPGKNGQAAYRSMVESKALDQLYRDRDPRYMRFIGDFINKFRNADLLVIGTYNPIHPEILSREFKNTTKILCFGDDPFSTYIRGIAYLWAFDGAFYITPSYNENFLFKDALKRWGCEHSHWWPLVFPNAHARSGDELWPLAAPRLQAEKCGDAFFKDRDLDLIYVGAAYSSKMDRLARFKKKFGKRMQIYGRWPYAGYVGALRGIKGKPALWSRITGISNQKRAELYYRTKIGINMHLSDMPMETGNARMYETPAHGMLLLCDKAGMNAHEQIFTPGKEAVFYDSTDDAIDKIEYYLTHNDERERIARAGFERAHRDYDGETNLKKFLDWTESVPRKKYPL